MNKNGHQSINCSVDSCKHYVKGHCGLTSIQVAPLSNIVDTAEDSMCDSFDRKDS